MKSIIVLYEAKDFLIINKPAGILVHPTKLNSDEETITEWLIEYYPGVKEVGDEPKLRPGIVHRLDRDTSGVLLIARTNKSFLHFKRAFQEKTISKTYCALVWGCVKELRGDITAPIGLKKGTVKRTVWQKNTRLIKEAHTKYRVKTDYEFDGDPLTLVEAYPLTGRTHQIRVHFNSLGNPIAGDKLYGGKKLLEKSKKLGLQRHFLHATAIEFDTPEGSRLQISSDLPKELEQVLGELTSVPEGRRQHN